MDPKGDWWGLRAAADGKGPGLPIVIVGGEHGDVPLEVGAGGKMLRGYRASATTEGARQIEGHVSHWATCTSPPARRKVRVP